MIRRPPRSTRVRSSAASDVYKRQRDVVGRVGHELAEGALQGVVVLTGHRTSPPVLCSPRPYSVWGRNRCLTSANGLTTRGTGSPAAGASVLLPRSGPRRLP